MSEEAFTFLLAVFSTHVQAADGHEVYFPEAVKLTIEAIEGEGHFETRVHGFTFDGASLPSPHLEYLYTGISLAEAVRVYDRACLGHGGDLLDHTRRDKG
jgi:hypothetical protein